MRERDDITPDCETERGCRIPPLSEDESRVLRMREMLIRLRGLVDSAPILELFCTTRDDLNLLAIVEEELMSGRETER